MNSRSLTLILVALCAARCYAQGDTPTEVLKKTFGSGSSNWADYLADTSSGSISAFSMLDISGDSIHPVENVRDVVVAIKGLGSSDSKTAVGFSITPARTSFTPMDLSTYAGSWPARLLGALNFGYAQGNASISGKDYERKAVSAETNFFFRDADDPIVAYAKAPCVADILEQEKPGGAKLKPEKPSGSPESNPPDTKTPGGAVKPAEATKADTDAARDRAKSCRDKTLKSLRWNRSQASASYATGWIKPTDGSINQQSLGRTGVIGLTYGFDGIERLREYSALSLAFRRTIDEPVLDTLQAASIDRKDSSLATVRLTLGSTTFRGLVEGSNTKSNQITSSERTFKRALGVDVRISEATWLNFRLGRQQKIDGTGTEVGSFMSLSYSPSALLNH